MSPRAVSIVAAVWLALGFAGWSDDHASILPIINFHAMWRL